MAFSLHLYSKDGRSIAGIPWALYNGFDYENDGRVEKLTILFMNRAVYIEGHNFQRAIDMMNACRLKGIGVHDTASAMLAEEEPTTGVVTAIVLDPEDFRTIVETTLSKRELEP